jgi:hypothetical protein
VKRNQGGLDQSDMAHRLDLIPVLGIRASHCLQRGNNPARYGYARIERRRRNNSRGEHLFQRFNQRFHIRRVA